MERETNPHATVLCRMGCGFYGNPAFEGMCSKCYKDSLKRKQSSPPLSGRASPSPGSASSMTSVSTSQVCTSSSATTTIPLPKLETDTTSSQHYVCTASAAASTPEKSMQIDNTDSEQPCLSSSSPAGSETSDSPDGKSKKRNRCTTCRKKVGLTGFECRCGGLFCGLHRYSDKHNCSYDYKADAREMIAKQNPVVVGEKVKKI